MTVDRPASSTAAMSQDSVGLLARHGELMDSQALIAFFKFGSDRSFRRSAAKAALPVAVFRVPGRSGWFARTQDVALWLTTAGQKAISRSEEHTSELQSLLRRSYAVFCLQITSVKQRILPHV